MNASLLLLPPSCAAPLSYGCVSNPDRRPLTRRATEQNLESVQTGALTICMRQVKKKPCQADDTSSEATTSVPPSNRGKDRPPLAAPAPLPLVSANSMASTSRRAAPLPPELSRFFDKVELLLDAAIEWEKVMHNLKAHTKDVVDLSGALT